MSIKDLFIIVVVILIVGGLAGAGSLFLNSGDSWSPRAYVPAEGECFVPSQGDPLYDEHYAKNVNNPNCNALLTQSESKFLDAQTKQLESDTTKGNVGFYGFLGVLVCLGILIIIAIIRG